MSSQMVNAVVNGQANPGLDFCKGISRALKMPLEDVFRLAGILPPKPPGGGFRPRRIVHQGNTADRLVELWGLLAPEDQQRVLDLAERLAPLPEPRIIGDAPDEEP
jgi:DNA-binding XRE family transcriptional regulator